MTCDDRLYRDIPRGGCFGWPGDHRPPPGVGGQLVQQSIAAAPSDDVDDRQLFLQQGSQLFCCPEIFQRQALQVTTSNLSIRLRYRLTGLPAKRLDAGDHGARLVIAGMEKACICA